MMDTTLADIVNHINSGEVTYSESEDNFYVTNKSGEVKTYSRTRLKIKGFYLTIDDFLEIVNKNNKLNIPDSVFYIKEINAYSYNDDNEVITKYKSIVGFISILIKNYVKDCDNNIVIVSGDTATTINIDFNAEWLKELPIKNIEHLDSISKILDDKSDTNPLYHFYCISLVDFVNSETDKSVIDFISKSNSFFLATERKYDAFITNHIRQRNYLQMEKESLEIIEKIRGVINDSQSQIVGIIISLTLASTQFDFDVNGNKLHNLIIIIALGICAIVIFLFLLNQRNSLSLVKQSKEKFEKKFEFYDKEINVLKKKYTTQNRINFCLMIITPLIPIILSIVLWLKNLL